MPGMAGLPELRSLIVDIGDWDLWLIGASPTMDWDEEKRIRFPKCRAGVAGMDYFVAPRRRAATGTSKSNLPFTGLCWTSPSSRRSVRSARSQLGRGATGITRRVFRSTSNRWQWLCRNRFRSDAGTVTRDDGPCTYVVGPSWRACADVGCSWVWGGGWLGDDACAVDRGRAAVHAGRPNFGCGDADGSP
jgi:hypothetical protein